MLHGFGAHYQDLVPLAQAIPSLVPATWVFPNAPLQLPFPYMGGRAWFPIEERLLLSGAPLDLSEIEAPGLEQASQMIFEIFENLKADYDSFYLGGFSQGSMVALDSYLQNDFKKIKGLILFSSTLLNQKRWQEGLAKTEATPVFLSHGGQDEVLPCSAAKNLKALLEENNYPTDWTEFSGGHEIPMQVLSNLNQWVEKI